jgi:hypothetical protein
VWNTTKKLAVSGLGLVGSFHILKKFGKIPFMLAANMSLSHAGFSPVMASAMTTYAAFSYTESELLTMAGMQDPPSYVALFLSYLRSDEFYKWFKQTSLKLAYQKLFPYFYSYMNGSNERALVFRN